MKPLILKSFLLSKFHGLFHGVSTKIANPNEFNFDLGNFNHLNLEKNLEHRKFFFNLFGIDYKSVVLQRQIHSTIYTFVDSPGIVDGNDAIVTNRRGLYLVVTIADCIPILFYDYKNQIVGAIHAGWRGTADQILIKTMDYAIQSLKIDVKTTYFYFGPSICKDCFEVDEDVAVKFESKYVRKKGKKFFSYRQFFEEILKCRRFGN